MMIWKVKFVATGGEVALVAGTTAEEALLNLPSRLPLPREAYLVGPVKGAVSLPSEAPEWASSYTLDEAAECLPYGEILQGVVDLPLAREESHRIHAALWDLLEKSDKEERAPQGGDGSEGTVEIPAERLEAIMEGSSDSLAENWGALDVVHQWALDRAWKKEWA